MSVLFGFPVNRLQSLSWPVYVGHSKLQSVDVWTCAVVHLIWINMILTSMRRVLCHIQAASKKRSKWDNPTKSSAAATGGGAAPSAAASATSGTAAASASQPRSRSVGSALPSAAATSVAHPQLRAAQLSAQIQAAQVAQRSLGVGIGVGALLSLLSCFFPLC